MAKTSASKQGPLWFTISIRYVLAAVGIAPMSPDARSQALAEKCLSPFVAISPAIDEPDYDIIIPDDFVFPFAPSTE